MIQHPTMPNHFPSPVGLDLLSQHQTLGFVKGPTQGCYKKSFHVQTINHNVELGKETVFTLQEKNSPFCCCCSHEYTLTEPNSKYVLATYSGARCCSSDWEIYRGEEKTKKIGEVKPYFCCDLGIEATGSGKTYKIHERCSFLLCTSKLRSSIGNGIDVALPGIGHLINEGLKVCCYTLKCWRRVSTQITNIPVNSEKEAHTLMYEAKKCCLCCSTPEFFINNFKPEHELNDRLALIGLNLFMFTDANKVNKEYFGRRISKKKVGDSTPRSKSENVRIISV